jgi:hypothetical protein
MCWLILLATVADAAITDHRSGAYVDLAGGLGYTGRARGPALGDPPRSAPAAALDMAVGGWWGVYDDDLSLGRYWGAGVRVEEDVDGPDVSLRPMVELRRGMDLIVVGVHGYAALGPVFSNPGAEDDTGLAARIGGGLELRRTPVLGIELRLEGGADLIDGTVQPAGSLLLGVHSFFSGER